MDLFAALVALGRRWYLTIVLLVLVIAGTGLAAKATKPDYKAQASVIVLAPRQDVAKATNFSTVNPYLGAGMPVFATVLSSVMTSDTTARQVVAQGGTGHYSVGQGTSTNGPIVHIEATDSSPAKATLTATILISLLGREAGQLQQSAQVPKNTYITVQPVTVGDQPAELQGSRTRVVVAVGAMGIVVTFATVLLVDSWLMARKAKQRRGRGRRGSDDVTTGKDEPASDGPSNGSEIPLARVRP